jgi:hypothetical protein
MRAAFAVCVTASGHLAHAQGKTQSNCSIVCSFKKSSGTSHTAQKFSQRILKCTWLGELNDIILAHGVSFFHGKSRLEHPHDTGKSG